MSEMTKKTLATEEENAMRVAYLSWAGQALSTAVYFATLSPGFALALTVLTAAVLMAASSVIATSLIVANGSRDLELRNLFAAEVARVRGSGMEGALEEVEAAFAETRRIRDKIDAAFARASSFGPVKGFALLAAIWLVVNYVAAWIGLRIQPNVAAALDWFEASAR